ncbi:hypothetical protein [Sphingobacterium psychroaquaticum]|uniref:Uncharacterized protein n=1 Tax=Sphingobacterium psychroaquaticum TaxID=561061 RepID=A0A1X7K5Z1_9SPHI|nr:hypothetical protein [Sphingobacterium psychroaquaticum]QBQ42653.1 hypothetical protein E2P86_16485 [Sphingobacterium psychroaquaticum]SMG36152.1 hypothetical protein SAMN05660862_2597 [Sphingobacterium psychroaquaticum]
MDIEDLMAGGEGQEAGGQPSPLKSLKVDLDFYKESIKEVATEMMAEGYTLYPIFVAHQHEISIGEIVLDKNELNTQWSIHASSLEEFVERGLIKDDRKAYFEKSFKNANAYMCLFVVVPEGANFVFYPY